MKAETNTTSPNRTLQFDSADSRPAPPLHILTLTPFFPFAANPVYGTYVSEPIAHFPDFNLHSTVIGVSPLHHERHDSLPSAAAHWLRYPTLPGNRGLAAAGYLLYRRLVLFVLRLHHHNPIDVIHGHAALPCGHAARLLAERLRIPFVVTVHGLDVFNACFESGTSTARRREKISQEVYLRAASVVCISRKVEDVLKQGVAAAISSCVIYNGTDPQLFFPEATAPPSRTPNVLIVGNLLRGKGHDLVLKAVAQVASDFPTLQCTMIGEGSDQGRFTDLARTLGIAERVFFRGRQDRAAVAQAMRDCTIFALPSRFEGLGCAYLEAMASAKPVIACEGQGIAEIIQHRYNGWLIPVDGLSELTEALRQLLNSPELRAQIGANARQTVVRGLTLSNQVHGLAELYRSIARRAGHTNMTAPMPAPPSSKVTLVDLTEPDVPELARFIATQSGASPHERLAHLTWLLLENPARRADERMPLGCGVRSTSGDLVGCILYLPQFFVYQQTSLMLLGSSCFYVDESHRGFGGALFLKFSRAMNQWPLFGNSANAIAAQLWKARGATPIPHSDHELLGIVNWSPVVEELVVRKEGVKPLARAAGAAASWLGHVRRLRFQQVQPGELVRLSNAEQIMDLQLSEPSDCLTARRDEPYMRWRYFSGRDSSIALFAFCSPQLRRPTFLAVNERPRGYRCQIRSLNILDVYPKPKPDVLSAIVRALLDEYRGHTHMIVLRNLETPCQSALLKARFQRREFDSPNGWLLDRQGMLPTQNFYFVPADGDWII